MSKKRRKKISERKKKSYAPTGRLINTLKERSASIDFKHFAIVNVPYVIVFYMADKIACLYHCCIGDSFAERAGVLFLNFQIAFQNPFPSLYPRDIAAGIIGAVFLKTAVYIKGKNAKKYRHGVEYGSARWGTQKDIAPYIDPVFENNIILTQTERLTMNSRPKLPQYCCYPFFPTYNSPDCLSQNYPI